MALWVSKSQMNGDVLEGRAESEEKLGGPWVQAKRPSPEGMEVGWKETIGILKKPRLPSILWLRFACAAHFTCSFQYLFIYFYMQAFPLGL